MVCVRCILGSGTKRVTNSDVQSYAVSYFYSQLWSLSRQRLKLVYFLFFLIRSVLTDYLYRSVLCGERFVVIFISCFVLLKL